MKRTMVLIGNKKNGKMQRFRMHVRAFFREKPLNIKLGSQMNTKLIRVIRIESVELDPQEVEEISAEEFELLPEYKPSGKEEEAEMLLRVGGKEREIDMEMMKRSVNLLVEDGVFKEVRNIFKLYGVPLKPLVNGIEVDIRDKMMEEG